MPKSGKVQRALAGRKVRSLKSPASKAARQIYKSAAGQKRAQIGAFRKRESKDTMRVVDGIIGDLSKKWWVTINGEHYLKSSNHFNEPGLIIPELQELRPSGVPTEREEVLSEIASRGAKQIDESGYLAGGGCSDFAELFVREARKRGIKANFIIAGAEEKNERGVPEPHTLVRIKDEKANKWKVVDPKWFAHPEVRRLIERRIDPTNLNDLKFSAIAKEWRENGLPQVAKGPEIQYNRVFLPYRRDMNRKILARTTPLLSDIPDLKVFLQKQKTKVDKRRASKIPPLPPTKHLAMVRARLLVRELEESKRPTSPA